MATGKFISKFNWRLILIHLPATLFLILGARKLAVLSDVDLIEAIYLYPPDDIWNHLKKPLDDITNGQRFYLFFRGIAYAGLITILVSFLISLFISIRNKIFWLNSLVVFILVFIITILTFHKLLFFKILSEIGGFGRLFESLGIKYVFIINGTILTLTGLFLFFNPWTKKFIRKQYDESHFAPKEKPAEELNHAGEEKDWTWE